MTIIPYDRHYTALEFDDQLDRDGDLEIVFDGEQRNLYLDLSRLETIAKAFGLVLVPIPTE